MTPPVWEPLGAVSPRALAQGRLLLHHAAQLPAAIGRSLAPAREDDGHTSLEWRAESRDLAGQEVPGPRPWRVALRPEELSLAVFAGGAEIARLSLEDRSRATAFAWLATAARNLGGPGDAPRLDTPYALPSHPVGDGAPFAAPSDGSLAELTRWLANGDALLRAAAAEWPGAAPVRVWPHHFDVGSVLPLERGRGHEDPSIGVGLSPGDEGIAEPYLYVTPWPPPPPESLPALPAGGRWNLEGWTGAVLTGSEIVAAGGAEAQAAQADRFLRGAVEVLRARRPGLPGPS
jgi:hypothetical protein